MFPVTLDELIPGDHLCRVIEAFVDRLAMAELGFQRSEPAATGRPGYDPRDLLKLYLYGYVNQVRSSRRLEAECQRNVELMWLLGRLRPDHKSIDPQKWPLALTCSQWRIMGICTPYECDQIVVCHPEQSEGPAFAFRHSLFARVRSEQRMANGGSIPLPPGTP